MTMLWFKKECVICGLLQCRFVRWLHYNIRSSLKLYGTHIHLDVRCLNVNSVYTYMDPSLHILTLVVICNFTCLLLCGYLRKIPCSYNTKFILIQFPAVQKSTFCTKIVLIHRHHSNIIHQELRRLEILKIKKSYNASFHIMILLIFC